VSVEIEEMLRRYAQQLDRLAPDMTGAEVRARAERLAAHGAVHGPTGSNGSQSERAYLVEEKDRRPLAFARARDRRRRVITVLAAAAALIVVTVAVAVTRPSRHHQPNGSGAPASTPHPTTATPLTASRVAQMLAEGQFATIASEIEPPSSRSADQVAVEQAWGKLSNAYGAFLSTETRDEGAFAPLGPPDSPNVADETVLQMSHGLILLRVTLTPDGGLVHLELWPLGWGIQVFPGQYFGF
jgi:hypothetical protein